MDLKDAVLNLQLNKAGLPGQVTMSSSIGAAPAPAVPDPYAPPESSLVQLSGYGQVLSSISQFSGGLQNASSAPLAATSSAPAVAAATVSDSASVGTHQVDVAQLAQAQEMTSAYFASASATYFTPGSFNIQFGSNSTSVNVQSGSLNGVASAINSANAGVTAAVQSDSFGSRLTLTSQQTGSANTFAVSASPIDPFGWNKNLGALALVQTRAPADASFTIDGAAQTSASNQGVEVAAGVAVNLLATGSAQVTVASNYQSALSSAQGLVAQYNVLRGNLNQMTSASGQLNGDATAADLSANLYNLAQSTFANPGSTLTTLSQIGMTSGTAGSPIALDTTALSAAYNQDPLGTHALLNQVRQSFLDLAQSYGGDGGTFRTQANQLMSDIQQDIQGALSGGTNLPQSVAFGIFQNQMLYGATQSQYAGISIFV